MERKRVRVATKATPRRPLDRDTVLRATLDLIDQRGVAAFSMRDLAAALGVFPTAIYWHVANRNDLIAGAVALALNGICEGMPPGHWQASLREIFVRLRERLRRHPRLAQVVSGQLVYNTWMDLPMVERVVSALEDAGFEGDSLVDAFNVVIAAMCGFATLELATPPLEGPASWEASCQARISSISPEEFPALGRHLPNLANRAFIVRWSGGATHPLQSGFDAWIDVVLGGLALRASQVTGAKRRPSRRQRDSA